MQGSELKLRPIDDCLESQLNQAFTSTSYLKLQDLDYTAGLAMKIAEAVSTGKQHHGSGCWLGKCLDLSKAYKQMGVNPAHRHLAVIFLPHQRGQSSLLHCELPDVWGHLCGLFVQPGVKEHLVSPKPHAGNTLRCLLR